MCLVVTVPRRASAQRVRSRDAGVAAVEYENGRVFSAFTLTDELSLQRERSSTTASGLLSLFQDGRWSFQGMLVGSRLTEAIPVTLPVARDWFSSMRGELALSTSTSAQQGEMPTLQLLTEARAHVMGEGRGLWAGGAFARVFDGENCRSTLLGDGGGWLRRGTTVYAMTFKPLQLEYGDLLADTEGSVRWQRWGLDLDASAGVRVGEAQRGTVAWLAGAASFPLREGVMATASVGSYPADLLQGLPGGRYLAFSVRLPTPGEGRRRGTRPPDRPAPRLPTPPDAPPSPEASITLHMAELGGGVRIVRVNAPAGTRTVEIMADFTQWAPATLTRVADGRWEMTAPVASGSHRLNVRLDGGEWLVPANLARITDEFNGVVGVVVLP